MKTIVYSVTAQLLKGMNWLRLNLLYIEIFIKLSQSVVLLFAIERFKLLNVIIPLPNQLVVFFGTDLTQENNTVLTAVWPFLCFG